MVTLIMASSPCRTASSSQDSQKDTASAATASANVPKIPECMPGIPARWFFSTKQLQEDNPSLKSGIDLEKELYYRQQAASFIHELGSKLQLTHLVMNVAMVYMHRFYVFHSFRRFPRNDVAAACVFLAAKVEEMPRKLEYIVKVSHALQHREEPALDTKSNRYNEEAQKIITFENVLLQTLGFDLTVAVPNQYVVKCIHMLKAPKELAQAAYHFTNDCLHLTTLCLRYRPAVVACASIFLACSWAKWEIPTSHEGKPWYYYVDAEVTKDILEALAEEMVKVYQKCPERLKIKRYLTGKREEGGASTSDGGAGEELQESSLYNSITASIAAAGRSSSTAPAPKIKVEVEVSAAQKSDVVASAEISTPAKLNPGANTEPSNVHPPSSEKKPKSEAAKVDLKSYMDRMKEGRPEQQVRTAADSPSTTARKSFMPDVSQTLKEAEDAKRQDSRAGDRHGRYRGNHAEPEPRPHSQRPASGNSGAYRQDQRPASGHDQRSGSAVKPEHGRQYPEGATNDGSSRKRHNDGDDLDERERKMARAEHNNGGNHGSNRNPKEGSRSGNPQGAESKSATHPAVSAVPKSGHGSGAVVNGNAWDDGRDKPPRRPDGDDRYAQKHQNSSNQKRPDDKESGRTGNDVSVEDDTLRQAVQKADQIMKLQKLERLKTMNMKTTTASSVGSGREKGSNSRQDTGTPPLPPAPPGMPPLPPGPPPPPPPKS